ncbi:CPBP family intramembrane glutamic endopeptidase [Halococcus thailandensis]
MVGVAWAGWHLPLFLNVTTHGGWSLSQQLLWVVSILAGSILWTWIYNSTGGSVLAVAVFHAGVNAMGIFHPADTAAMASAECPTMVESPFGGDGAGSIGHRCTLPGRRVRSRPIRQLGDSWERSGRGQSGFERSVALESHCRGRIVCIQQPWIRSIRSPMGERCRRSVSERDFGQRCKPSESSPIRTGIRSR